MKKILFLVVAGLFGVVGITQAQIQQGNLMLGTDLGSGLVSPPNSGLFGFNFGLNDGAGYSVGISPKIGYFIKDNLMIGGVVDLGFNKSANTTGGAAAKTTVYGIQALGRYYVNPGERGIDNLLQHGRFFAEANAGFAGVNIKDGATTNGFAFGFGPGYSYFVTPNVALEALVKYNGLLGGGNTTYQHALGVNFGVQVFLPSARVRSMVKDPSQL
ncbi:MAG TPA: hypothetical protein VL053_14370 [Arachidicoccus sp.]|nr:hypothetical protein [Arachidicoccus sp.]